MDMYQKRKIIIIKKVFQKSPFHGKWGVMKKHY